MHGKKEGGIFSSVWGFWTVLTMQSSLTGGINTYHRLSVSEMCRPSVFMTGLVFVAQAFDNLNRITFAQLLHRKTFAHASRCCDSLAHGIRLSSLISGRIGHR